MHRRSTDSRPRGRQKILANRVDRRHSHLNNDDRDAGEKPHWTREGERARDGDFSIRKGNACMKIYGADDREMMNITSLERDGSDLVVKGKLFGAMPLTAKLRPEDARAALRLLNFRTALFLLTLLFRRKR